MILETAMAKGPFHDRYHVSSTRSSRLSPSPIDSILKLYEKSLDLDYRLVRRYSVPQLIRDCTLVTTPAEIQRFISLTQSYERHPNYAPATGLLLSQLIQNAHDKGETYFHLDLRAIKPFNLLLNELHEQKDHTLTVHVLGEVGDQCAYLVRGGAYYIESVGDDFGEYAMPNWHNQARPLLCVQKAGEYCAQSSENADFYIQYCKNVVGESSSGSKIYIKNIESTIEWGKRESEFYTVSSKENEIKFNFFADAVKYMSEHEWDIEWNKATERFKGDLK